MPSFLACDPAGVGAEGLPNRAREDQRHRAWHQVQEYAPALGIEAYDLGVDNRVLDPEPGHGFREWGKGFVDVPVSGSQFTGTVFHVGCASPAVHFQLPDKVGIIKSGPDSGWGDGLDQREHPLNYRGLAEGSSKWYMVRR